VGEDRGDVGAAAVRDGARQALEQQARQAVLVRPPVELLAADLLGRDVVDRAHELAVGGAALGRALGQAEVGQVAVLAPVAVVEQDVARLHVAVDEAAAMGGVEGVRDLRGDRDRARRIERPLAPQQRLEVAAGDVAHRDEQAPLALTGLVDRDHVRVVEAGREPRLAQQPLVGRDARREQLEGDRAAEPEVRRAMDLAHPAAPEQLLDAVPLDVRAGKRVSDGHRLPPARASPTAAATASAAAAAAALSRPVAGRRSPWRRGAKPCRPGA
jgi:hypothetical protein